MGHNKQSGGFREAPVEPLEGYEAIPTVDNVPPAFDPVTGQPLSEALRARPDPAAGKKLQEARAAEAIEQEKRMAAGATTRPREGLEFLRPQLEDLPTPEIFVPFKPERPAKTEAGVALKTVSEFEPKGDQPTAIEELVKGIKRRRARPGAARRHRLRQNLHHGQGDRGDPAARPDPGAQQDAGRAALRRVPPVLPRKLGRVFRLLLRLLPAGGLRSAHRYLYREGKFDQRADRPYAPLRHPRAAGAR